MCPKKSGFKRFLIIITVMALMFGSGYAGAMFTADMHDAAAESSAAVQAYMPQVIPQVTDNVLQIIALGEDGSMSLPDLFDGANPAVVAISTETVGRNAFGIAVTRPASGSGFLVTADGYIVTNDHVIYGADSIEVLLHNGRAFPARLVGRDPGSDLAVIKIEQDNLPHLRFADSADMRVGEQVAAIGNPLGELANSLTVGYISALSRYITIDNVTLNMLQTDAAVNPGNSGGPLLNLRGEVVGVVTAKSIGRDVEGLGFAIPANHAAGVVRQLIDYGFIRGRAILGIIVNVSEQGQVQVSSVQPQSAAYRAGIQPGDIILAANGVEIRAFADLRALLDTLSPGDTIEVRIRRGAAETTITTTLDEYRPAGF